jgi:hypothetical protein
VEVSTENIRCRNLAPALASIKLSVHGHLLLSGLRINTKTGSDVSFKLHVHIDSDLHGFTRETISLQTFNSNAQNCHNKINTYLLLRTYDTFLKFR